MSIILYIFLAVLLVSFVSLVGILAIFFREDKFDRALSFLIPPAGGALLGDAFFHLIPEAFSESTNPATTSLLISLGVISFFFLEKILRWHHHHSVSEKVADNHGTPSHLGHMVLASDAFHNFLDGIIIAASFLVSIPVGIATTLAVILHEIPQELGDFGVLLYAGYKRTTALFYNFLSALTAVAGAALVLILGSLPEGVVQGVLPFAAGVFIYIACSDLVPELHKQEGSKRILPETLGIGLGILAMYLLLFLE